MDILLFNTFLFIILLYYIYSEDFNEGLVLNIISFNNSLFNCGSLLFLISCFPFLRSNIFGSLFSSILFG